MEELKLANKQAMFEKLSSLKVVDETIRCDDLINTISTSPARDKRLISNYSDYQMVIKKVQSKNYTRLCRMFTVKGIERYVHEGKVYSYANVCRYFGLTPIDQELTELKSYYINGQFVTKKVLKWYFGKRKQVKKLGTYITKEQLIEWLPTSDRHKYKLINQFQVQQS